MFKEIGLENIRVFKNRKYSFKLPNLAIFCGTNSSGKSTVLKSFLLLRQSLGIHESYGALPGTLRFSGSQVDLGNYATLVSENDVSRNIGITISFEDLIPTDVVEQLAENKKLVLNCNIKRYMPYSLYV